VGSLRDMLLPQDNREPASGTAFTLDPEQAAAAEAFWSQQGPGL
jgi:hypothetical protein